MKRELSMLFSLVSLVLSVIAICIAAWRSPELGFDYQGVLVGVLSLLVTVLIGWQIYNFVYINKKVASLEQTAKDITKESVDQYKHSVRSIMITLTSSNMYLNNLTEYAIDNYIRAIEEGLKGSDKDGILLPLGYLEMLINNNNGKVQILKGNKHFYLEILSKLKDEERKKDIIDAVIFANEVEAKEIIS